MVKVNSDCSMERRKVMLVYKEQYHSNGVYYSVTISLVAKLFPISLLISQVVSKSSPLHQFNFQNTFMYGDIQKEVYMEHTPGFHYQGDN